MRVTCCSRAPRRQAPSKRHAACGMGGMWHEHGRCAACAWHGLPPSPRPGGGGGAGRARAGRAGPRAPRSALDLLSGPRGRRSFALSVKGCTTLNCVRSSFSSPPFLRRQAGGAQTRLARRQPHSSPCATTHRRLLVGRRGRLRDSYLPICHALTSPFLPTRSSSRRTRLGVGRCKWCLRPCHHRPCLSLIHI